MSIAPNAWLIFFPIRYVSYVFVSAKRFHRPRSFVCLSDFISTDTNLPLSKEEENPGIFNV